MATNYTANYGLCQWEPGDNFLRTEFNQDNAKIDAALAGHTTQLEQTLSRSQLIRTLTTTVAANSISIDVNNIDWSEWEWVSFFVDYRADYGSEAVNCIYCDLNNGSVTTYCSAGYGLMRTQPNPVQLILLPHHDPSSRVQAISIGSPGGAGAANISFSELTCVRLHYIKLEDGYSGQFPVGMEITMRGMK